MFYSVSHHRLTQLVERSGMLTRPFTRFHNDLDIAQIVNWSRKPQNQSAPGISDRIHTWYPLFSRYYVPEQRGRTQDRHGPHSLNEDDRRDSYSFRDQQFVETSGGLSGYNGPSSLQIPYPSISFNGSPPTPGFPPSNGIFYQQIHPLNQQRLLYNPKAPQRRDSKVQIAEKTATKTERKLWAKSGYSQDVRRSRLLPEGPWRHPEGNSTSEEAITEEASATIVKEKPSAPSNEKAKNWQSTKEGSASQDASLNHSGNDSLHVDTALQVTTEVCNLQTGCSQGNRPQRAEHRMDQPEKKTRTGTFTKDRTPSDDPKIAPGKCSTNNAASPLVTTSDTGSPSQRAGMPTNTLETGVKGANISHSTEIQTTEPVQEESMPMGELHVIDGHGHESNASSRTMSPQTASSSDEKIATHHGRSPVGSRTRNKKQTGLAESIETSSAIAAVKDKATGGYSMTTSQLSSAVEDFSYSTETIIRHKPGRPSLPLPWATVEVGDDDRTGTQSSSAGVNLDRFRDVDNRINAFRVQTIVRISPEEMAEDLITRGRMEVNSGALMAKEMISSSESSVSSHAETTGDSLGNLATKSAVVTEQNPAPSRDQRNKNKSKKKKSQGVRSHLTSRTGTPVDTQSLNPSSVPKQSLSVDAFDDDSLEPSSTRQRNNGASSECSSQPGTTRNKHAKKKTKRTPLMPENSDVQASCSGSRENKKQGDSHSSLRKTEVLQANLAKESAIQTTATVANLQSLHDDKPEKASNAEPRPNTTGGSLRMSKDRSQKTGGQKDAPQNPAKSKASTAGEVSSLSFRFNPTTEEITGVPSETNAFADQNLIVDETRKPKSSTDTFNLPRNTNARVALPRAALPLPQVARSSISDGSWASVAKNPVVRAPKSNKLDQDDPFTVDKERVALGDFVRAKNLKFPLKDEDKEEKESVSHVEASPIPSSEKKIRHQNATNKTQLNATVKYYSPLAYRTPSLPSTRQKLNPNAATFSLPPSVSQSVASTHAPGCDQPGGHDSVMEDEKAFAVETRKTIPGRNSGRKRHSVKSSFPEHAASTDKRFITPSEQVLDAMNVVQPPPPSKEGKRAGSIPERACKTGREATLTIDAHQTNGDKPGSNSKSTTDNISTTEGVKIKDVQEGVETRTGTSGNVDATPQSTAHKTLHEHHSTSNDKTINIDLFPTLDQAATVGQNKKSRDARITKTGVPASLTIRGSGTVMRSDTQAVSHLMDSDMTQQDGAEAKPTIAQRLSGDPAPVAENAPEPRLVQKRTDVQRSGLKQDSEKGAWQTVTPKQKNKGGAKKGYHDGRTGKCGSVRTARGGRGGRDGAMEERKGG